MPSRGVIRFSTAESPAAAPQGLGSEHHWHFNRKLVKSGDLRTPGEPLGGVPGLMFGEQGTPGSLRGDHLFPRSVLQPEGHGCPRVCTLSCGSSVNPGPWGWRCSSLVTRTHPALQISHLPWKLTPLPLFPPPLKCITGPLGHAVRLLDKSPEHSSYFILSPSARLI